MCSVPMASWAAREDFVRARKPLLPLGLSQWVLQEVIVRLV